MIYPNHSLVSRAVALALAMSSNSAFSQSEPESATLGEVVITAQKREESVQTATLSINAVSGTDMARAGVKDFTTINKIAPEINVNPGNGGTVVAVRGIRSNSFGATDESNNALHVDGAYLARFQGLTGLFFDVQRVEVAAGPQGTLYGRNATGGAVNVITNKPQHDFGGYANLETGTYNLIAVEAALNMPLNEQFAVRLAARHYKHDGYYKDTGTDDADQDSGRLSALWNISDTQSLLLTADAIQAGGKGVGQNIESEGPEAFQPINASDGSPGLPAVGAVAVNGRYVTSPTVVVSSDPRLNQAQYGNADQNSTLTKLKGFMAQYDHDLGFANLTAQASYRDLYTRYFSGSLTGSLQTAYALPGTFNVQKSGWGSTEIRLASSNTTSLKWVTGIYGFNEHLTDGTTGTYLTNNFTNPAARPVNPFTLPAAARSFSTPPNTTKDYTTLAYAVFGEATWSPSEPLHLTGGLRYNVDKKTFVGQPVNGVDPPERKGDWDQMTWRVNVAYDLSKTNRVYANVAKGYKSGGFAFGSHPEYKPEFITAFEIGSKNEFFNNRLRLNGAAWYYKYTDYETPVNLCINETPSVCNNATLTNNQALGVTNAGGARTYGASLSAEALLFSADRLHASVQWLDAKYTDFDLRNVPIVAPSARRDYTNTRVGYAAEWAGNTSYTHVWKIGEGTLDAQVAIQFASERPLANQAQPGTPQATSTDAYTAGDISLRYAPGKKWDVTAYVNNVTDELIKTVEIFIPSVYQAVPANPNTSYFSASYMPPRTYGLILSVNF